MNPLTPARVRFTPEGPASAHYQDRYHGPAGALAQARGVFLAGCGLPEGWRGRRSFTVVETGFGLGFNFLATWQAWRTDPERSGRLDFLSIECHPVALTDLARAHAAEAALEPLARQLRLRLPPALPGCHRLEFDAGQVTLTLVYGDGADALAELDAQADALFLDGFAPDRNPDLWSAPVMGELARLARAGARVSTWCATGALRRALAAAGFEAERAPGFAGKRETTSARRQGLPSGEQDTAGATSAVILGAGVAGCHLAERLCRRGWQVTLLDAAARPACGASGNPAGVVRPLLSRDDNRPTRFTRAAFLYALGAWRDPQGRPIAGWHPGGALQLARDARQAQQWQLALRELALPGEYAAWLDAPQAAACSGFQPAGGGLMFALGGWAQPALLCAGALARCDSGLDARWNACAARVDAAGPGWRVLAADGTPLAEAAHVVFATGAGPALGTTAPRGTQFMPPELRALQALRGEITRLRGQALSPLEVALCGDGYLVPDGAGDFTLGATYDRAGDAHPSAAGQASNLAHLGPLTGLDEDAVCCIGGRASWRSVAADRLPLVGADPQRPGVWHLRALASRGLVWSALSAELLAAEMSRHASPLARGLRGLLSLQRPVLKENRPHAPDPTPRHRRQPAP